MFKEIDLCKFSRLSKLTGILLTCYRSPCLHDCKIARSRGRMRVDLGGDRSHRGTNHTSSPWLTAFPPKPIVSTFEANWPTKATSQSFFEKALLGQVEGLSLEDEPSGRVEWLRL
jgi:hypothetical protein